MKILDNITSTVRDDLRVEIKKGSKVSIAAACFSMYAYKELKKQLESVDEFRFIFTSPTFVKEKAEKQKREFYIPRLSRETSLYGTEFEIKLRNEMTQRAIAKECADWIRKKAKFKSNTTGENMAGFMTVDSKTAQTAYMPINGFTTVDIGCERGNNSYNMVNCMEAPFAQQYMQLFDGLWNDREKMEVRRSSHCPAGVAVYCCQRQGAAVFHSQRPYAPQRRYRDYQCLRQRARGGTHFPLCL